jgi:hypothetical protein
MIGSILRMPLMPGSQGQSVKMVTTQVSSPVSQVLSQYFNYGSGHDRDFSVRPLGLQVMSGASLALLWH